MSMTFSSSRTVLFPSAKSHALFPAVSNWSELNSSQRWYRGFTSCSNVSAVVLITCQGLPGLGLKRDFLLRYKLGSVPLPGRADYLP